MGNFRSFSNVCDLILFDILTPILSNIIVCNDPTIKANSPMPKIIPVFKLICSIFFYPFISITNILESKILKTGKMEPNTAVTKIPKQNMSFEPSK